MKKTWCEIGDSYHKIKSSDETKTECDLGTSDATVPKLNLGSYASNKKLCPSCKAS